MKPGAIMRLPLCRTECVPINMSMLVISTLCGVSPFFSARSFAAPKVLTAEDFIERAVERGMKVLLADLEITEPIERALMEVAFRGKVKGTSSVLSITLFKPNKEAKYLAKSYHKVLNEQFTIRLRKVTSSKIASLLAVISHNELVDGKSVHQEHSLLWDGEHWRDIESEEKPR